MADNKENIEEILENDENYKEGLAAYRDIETKAHEEAGKLAQELVERIIKKEDKFNLSIAIMAVSKTLTHLASYLYDNEDEFLSDVQKARTSVVTDVIPALLDPTPCGKCEACKNGKPMECINPDVRGDYTQTRFLPVLANMLIEYDMFNKVLHMYALRDENDMGPNEPENGSNNGSNNGENGVTNESENGSNPDTIEPISDTNPDTKTES